MNPLNPPAPGHDITRRNFMKKSALTVGAATLLGQGIGLAEGPSGYCNANRTWRGIETTKMKFYGLTEEILAELRASFDEALAVLGNTADLVAQLAPFGAVGGIWKLIRELQTGDYTSEATEALIEAAKAELEAAIWLPVEHQLLILLGMNEEQLWQGSASQIGTTLSGPAITGPEQIVADSIALGFEAAGMQVQGTIDRTLGIYISGVTPAKCGFGHPDGPTVLTCACAGGAASIADIPIKKASMKVTLSIIGFEFNAEGTAEETGSAVVVEIKGGTQ